MQSAGHEASRETGDASAFEIVRPLSERWPSRHKGAVDAILTAQIVAVLLATFGNQNAHLETGIRKVGIHAAWVPVQVLDHGLEVGLAQVLARLR